MSKRKKTRRGSAKTEQSGAALSGRTAEILCVGAVLILACALILPNLGDILLWQDEAQTALVAKTILSHGVPLGTDGKNYLSQEFGAEYGKNYVWWWHPWFPFYVLAGFFAVLGTSTFVCRLPFALAGIGTVVMIYYYAKILWRSRRAGVLAAAILLLNVPFLLLVRQCRYYSMAALFSLAGLYAYSEMLKGRKYAPTVFFVSVCLLFHTFYVYVPALLVTVVVHSAIFRRDRLKSVMLVSALSAAVNLPWMIYFSGVYRMAHPEYGILGRSVIIARDLLVDIGKHVFHPALLLIPLVVIAARSTRLRSRPQVDSEAFRGVVLILLFAAFTLAVLAPASPNSFFRYLAPVIPVLILIEALILESGMKLHPMIGVVPLLLLGYWARMPDYLYEITHHYSGPIDGIVQYLKDHAGKDDIVTTTHEDLPLKFYTNLRVVGVATGEDLSKARDADWFVFRRHLPEGDQAPADTIMKHFAGRLQKIELDCPDLVFQNREDPDTHYFRTVKSREKVLIVHRISD